MSNRSIKTANTGTTNIKDTTLIQIIQAIIVQSKNMDLNSLSSHSSDMKSTRRNKNLLIIKKKSKQLFNPVDRWF